MSGQAMSPYQAYKDSGAFWLGDIPEEWSCQQLKYVADLSTEKVIPSASVRYVGMENVRSGDGSFVNTDEQEPEGLSLSFANSDVLFGKLRPYLAKSWLASFSGICSSEFLVLGARKVSPRFLNYTTLSREFISIVDSSTYGAKMPRASWDFIGVLKVPVPDFGTSVQIARFLDYETAKIDALIEKQQQLIALLKEKRQAVISHAVTEGLNPDAPLRDSGVEWLGEVPAHWEVGALSYALNAIGDVDHYMPPSIEEGVPYVMTGDLEELASEIDFTRCKQVAHHDYLRLCKKIKTTKGDLIMARYATIGTVSYVDLDSEFLVSYSCVTIKPNTEKALGRYLFFCLKSDSFVQGIQERINTNTQGNVGIADLRKVKVALPKIEEQLRITEYLRVRVAKMGKVIESSEATIDLLQERRTALISAAVTGKIDVRNWKSPDDE